MNEQELRRIDFHGHFLPKMDDGSKSVAQSISMLQTMKRNGIARAIATPHFYADDEPLDRFLARREAAYNALRSSLNGEDIPEISLGAEVRYYAGISRLDGLEKLRLEGSRLLLLEMPFCHWSESTIQEVLDMCANGHLTIVLAHIDRYLKMQDKNVWERLLASGALFQCNAESFRNLFTRMKLLGMFRKQMIHFVGSDCHNETSRPPNVELAFETLERKFGTDFLHALLAFENEMLPEIEKEKSLV